MTRAKTKSKTRYAEVPVGEGLEAKVETITPEIASDILERGYDFRNRPVRRTRVDEYARAMLDGAWQLTGDTIKLGIDGQLFDGQHRLWAVIESGVTIQSLVVRGIKPEAFPLMDVGARRSTADLLSIRGYGNASKLAATAGFWWSYERLGKFVRPVTRERPRNDQLADLLGQHPGLSNWFDQAKAHRNIHALGITHSLFAAILYAFGQKDEEQAADFLYLFATGAGLSSEHPILMLREALMRRMAQGERRTDYEYLSALVIKVWNAWREGRVVQHLRYTATERYPEII